MRHEGRLAGMNAIPFGKAVPVFGKAAPQGFGRKGGATLDNAEPPKQDGGALDTARTVLEAANDFKDEATAAICRRVIEASMKGAQPALSDLRIINNYFQ
jgi:hypothetical protein